MAKEERVTERRIIEDDSPSSEQKEAPAARSAPAENADSRLTAQNVVYYILGLIEAILLLRFILKLFGANPTSGFVDFIYDFSSIFVAPFRGIFSTPTAEGDIVESVFETSTLIAMIVYALVAYGIARLLTIDRSQ